mmetsp:Transcript_8037/g.10855  ORF Transcript_8037/g.10855 Transcript_8037/m.10855 type:complete len:253 (+) Transcript_8037:1584-2342(+)
MLPLRSARRCDECSWSSTMRSACSCPRLHPPREGACCRQALNPVRLACTLQARLFSTLRGPKEDTLAAGGRSRGSCTSPLCQEATGALWVLAGLVPDLEHTRPCSPTTLSLPTRAGVKVGDRTGSNARLVGQCRAGKWDPRDRREHRDLEDQEHSNGEAVEVAELVPVRLVREGEAEVDHSRLCPLLQQRLEWFLVQRLKPLLSPPPRWLRRRQISRSRCWESACSLWSTVCNRRWQERLLVCFWKWTTRSC